MEKEKKGINFYMLPAQILNDKNLNHAEKLTMAILNGLAYEDGTCYPSNEWLCEKLNVKKSAINEILQKLERNNYIKREIISCANNPFKKYRIIYINTNFKLSLREPENRPIGNPENRLAVGRKTGHIIDKKEIIEEEIPRQQAASPPDAKALELCELLFEAIKKTYPNKPKPNFIKWAAKMEAFMRIEKRVFDNVKKIIEWLPSAPFMGKDNFNWKEVILSPDKLREHFDQLQACFDKNAFKCPSRDLELIKAIKEHPDLGGCGLVETGANYVDFKGAGLYYTVDEKDFFSNVTNRLKIMGYTYERRDTGYHLGSRGKS